MWCPRNVRRRAKFCPTRYEQCARCCKRGSRFGRHAEPLQIESAKLHAPPGILPPDPTDLLRPFAPAGEAAGDAQQPPPQVLTSRGVGGRPKGATKCDKCPQNKRRCGPNCPNWPGVQPIAQTAAPAQLPALAAAAMPLQSAPVATEGSSAEPRPLLAAAATAAPTDGA